MPLAAFRRRIAALTLAGLLATGLGPTGSDAAEVLLFDGPDCTGEVRMLDRSVADFRQIGFDNRVSSIVVLSGVWQFFRDAGYRQIRGPAFVHSGFSSGNGTQPPCVAVQAASDGRFPGNLM